MRRISLLIAILTALVAMPRQAAAQYNNWAFGFRLGEPSGVNVRKYFGENHAFDLNIGTYGGLYGNNRSYRSGYYKTIGLSVQGHYLWHDRLFGKDNIRGYYGFGGQINSRRYYPDRFAATNDYETGIALGGSGVAGLEYFVPNKQYSFFLETGLYAEVLPAPLFLSLSSGVGIRFNL
ncbi:hypothetical protein [Fibrivirga algicola]|uniref:Outer membrane protein beta-barrel domain-containing protein n=1 Tax=Fibrivirga algicola TaxID=2950420 RepID=A0ABX0QG49_9BACT|nr:hypothetical protein [Fibrivirga algicola]ARK12141.1 hypothetical protein A6C57_18395 [Fibrella sp. ES10-3-2-2]NID11022.1 hypothetical protein [Fibrivirga algicola]